MSRQSSLLLAAIFITSISTRATLAGTVAYYRFGEAAAGASASSATGAIIDSAANPANGTAINGPVYSSNVPANPVPLTQQANPTSLSLCPFDQPHLRAGGVTRHHASNLEVSHGCIGEEYHGPDLA